MEWKTGNEKAKMLVLASMIMRIKWCQSILYWFHY